MAQNLSDKTKQILKESGWDPSMSTDPSAPVIKEENLHFPQIEVGKTYRLDSAGGSSYSFVVKSINDLKNTVEVVTTVSNATKILGLKQCNDALRSGSLTEVKSKVIDESYSFGGDDSPRPARMERPNIEGMTRNAKAYWSHLYIQDEAEDIFQDKYGKERGTKMWEGSINSSYSGAMYQAVTFIVMEKAKMLNDIQDWLRQNDKEHKEERLINMLNDSRRNYFTVSWFEVWKEWMRIRNKKYNPEPKKPKVVAQPTQMTAPVKPAFQRSSLWSTVQPEDKDYKRIRDLIDKAHGDRYKERQYAQNMANKIGDFAKAIRRYKAAEDDNYHNVAEIFSRRAEQLQPTNESKMPDLVKDIIKEALSEEPVTSTKIDKFLETVRTVDRNIQLKDVTVEATPKGNWAVYQNGKKLTTVSGRLLDMDTIQEYELEHHDMNEEVLTELSPQTYKSIQVAGHQRGDQRGRKIAGTATSLLGREFENKVWKVRRVGASDIISTRINAVKMQDVIWVITPDQNYKVYVISGEQSKPVVKDSSGNTYEVDRATANLISKMFKVYEDITIAPNQLAQF